MCDEPVCYLQNSNYPGLDKPGQNTRTLTIKITDPSICQVSSTIKITDLGICQVSIKIRLGIIVISLV